MSKKKEINENKEDSQEVDSELQNIVEAALYAADQPLGIRKLMNLFPEDAQPSKVEIQNVLLSLEELCANRGVELRRIGKGWRFQSKEKYSTWLRKIGGQKPPRYSRALLETLAIIAYQQPVTRGDIEEIRGVGVSSDTIRTLEEREWVQQIGHRDVPGRPALFGTTQAFLEYFNMTSLRELPELMDKRALGEIAKDMNLTLPMDGVQSEADADQTENMEANASSAKIIELHPDESRTEPKEGEPKENEPLEAESKDSEPQDSESIHAELSESESHQSEEASDLDSNTDQDPATPTPPDE